MRKDEGKARAALEWYRQRKDVDAELEEMAADKETQAAEQSKPFTLAELFTKKYRHQLAIALVLQVYMH